jgi:hypothetical protein
METLPALPTRPTSRCPNCSATPASRAALPADQRPRSAYRQRTVRIGEHESPPVSGKPRTRLPEAHQMALETQLDAGSRLSVAAVRKVRRARTAAASSELPADLFEVQQRLVDIEGDNRLHWLHVRRECSVRSHLSRQFRSFSCLLSGEGETLEPRSPVRLTATRAPPTGGARGSRPVSTRRRLPGRGL